jgi:2-isopropylmalate synthase
MPREIKVYDTTLRDGTQGEGVSFSMEDKVRIAQRLDALGIHYIEGGWPGSNPKDLRFFKRVQDAVFKSAKITAFGSTRRPGVKPQEDSNIQALVEAGPPVVTIFGKSWDLHVTHALGTTLDENVAMIGDSVAYLLKHFEEVIYDAEHFFDGFKKNREYALTTLKAAEAAGAHCLVLCDTNGGGLPHEVAEIVREVKKHVKGETPLGIHVHNDTECAVANTLAAVSEGVNHIQGTINGYGERCGNANLVSIIPNLQLKLGYECIPPDRLGRLTETAHYVAELLNFTPDPDQPYVGKNAFAHKGGMHVAGVNADPATFEHLDPADVGNRRDLIVSELSGKGTVQARARAAGLDLDDEAAHRVVERVKDLEHEGYHFEAADGSFELLLRKETGDYEPLFRLESWRAIVEKRADGKVETEATIKIWVGGERYVRTAEGNGPVNALDKALREAIAEIYPHLKDIDLVNFKVRILDERKGTGAVTRVLLDASDGTDVWGSIGVSENIIEASWDALVDSLERGLQEPKSSVVGRQS